MGFKDDWLLRKMDSGVRYFLIVFPLKQGRTSAALFTAVTSKVSLLTCLRNAAQAVQATWDNVFNLVEAHLPAAAAKLGRHKNDLRELSYAEVVERAGHSFEGCPAELYVTV